MGWACVTKETRLPSASSNLHAESGSEHPANREPDLRAPLAVAARTPNSCVSNFRRRSDSPASERFRTIALTVLVDSYIHPTPRRVISLNHSTVMKYILSISSENRIMTVDPKIAPKPTISR